MKKLIIAVCGLALASCGPNRNDQMTSLINQKKSIESDIKFYQGKKWAFEYKADPMVLTTDDSDKPKRDSAYKYTMLASDCEYALKAIDFSIDSLSKMK